jgi:hypothetical protein
VIPDLSVEKNRSRWERMEQAKRRVLVGLKSIGVPLADLQSTLPLWFEFKADGAEPVSTGHADGVIVINVREADDVEREKSRVAFGEPQRTLVGHFRHELGHYFWDVLVKPHCLEEYRALFGDETNPSYADAQQAYYQSGPPDDWRARFVSGYATMHSWEDFAETFGTYLDLRAVLDTAQEFKVTPSLPHEFQEMLLQYQSVGIMANEWNRDMGLLDLVPEVFVEPVRKKLHFVHRLLTEVGKS